MKTFAKVIGFLFLGIVALIVALPFIIPVDYIFKQVTQSVEQTTGRTLEIKGDKTLSVFPKLKLELNDVAFSNFKQGSQPSMASMDQLAIHIPYLSVLTGDIKLEKFVINNPSILLEKMPNGDVNWQLVKTTGAQDENSRSSQQGASQGLPEGLDIQLGEVAIYGGSFTFIDHQNNTSQKVTDLDLAIKLPSLKKELKVEGAVTYMAEKFELDVTLNTPEKLLLGQDFTLKTLLDSRLVSLTFDGLVAKQMTDFSGKLEVTGDSVKALAKWQNQALIAKDNAFNKFSIVSEMRFVGQELNLSKLDASLDELAIKGSAKLALTNVPKITANVDLGMLNVNPYLPESIDVPEESKEQTTQTPSEPQPIAWDDSEIDLSALNIVNADIKVAATGFQFKEIKLGETKLSLKLNNGTAQLGLDKFKAYEGDGTGQIVLVAKRAPYKMNTSFSFEGIQAEPLLSDAVGFDKLMGKGELTIALNTQGQSQKEFVNALHGAIGFGFKDGAVKGANIAAMVRSAEQLINGGGLDAKGLEKGFDNAEKTDFSALTGNFQFVDGVSKQNDLSLKSPLIRVSGNGDIDLPATKINYRLVTGIVDSIEGQGTQDQSTGFKIPIRIKGPFHDVQVKPDIGDAAKDKAKDKIKDKLKSLFN
ncbi:AsmA family protein [Pseudoalteromonas piratica]|uniref:Membrane assembly protein AsmA n=1 Tax=Pseudoalteromonas piratica TaxID=1348114 RepID=A0A0A7EEA5_9GAMM|nr:AsmA family protein [Pseudoalteromonas piratica]AIY64352.1 membrane assembly protein AsmA [Pseudoalteromonas piratica]